MQESFLATLGEEGGGQSGLRGESISLVRQDEAPERNPSAASPSSGARDLFTFVPAPEESSAVEQRAPVAASQVYYVELNDALIAGKQAAFRQPGSRITIPLPSGGSVEVEIEASETLGPDHFTSTGHVVGVPEGRAIFGYFEGRLSGRIENLPQGDLQLRPLNAPNGKELNQLYVVDPTLVPNCGGGVEVEIGQDAPVLLVEGGKNVGALPVMSSDQREAPLEVEPLASGQAIIDVLMVYTSSVREALGSEAAVMAAISGGIAKVNSDFSYSGITARIRLAGAMEADYPEDAPSGSAPAGFQNAALEAVRDPLHPQFAAVHAQRDAVGADLVCLLVQRLEPSGGSSGVGYILKEPRGSLGSLYAFSVVSAAFVTGDGSVLSHELGHNLGCAHARGDPDVEGTDDGAYAYSYGYRFDAQPTAGPPRKLRTLMAYLPGDRIPYFSNPRLTLPPGASYNGFTYRSEEDPLLGVAEGSDHAADNARTIEQNAFQVASYRVSTDFSDVGALVNVSTLAAVGVNGQPMIAGFVIQGSGVKRVLLRAVGPTLSLAPYNVGGALTDPTLTLHGGANLLQSNDDWWRGTVGVAAAFKAVGAFELPSNSRDAALLVDLKPGDYSATVASKSGSGRAIVEAYEIHAGGSRLVNLSTLAYGSRADPIVAGFVVRADPAQSHQRKRMFIRIRGPSLESFGVSGAMGDPMMKVYNEAGELVLEVDDWDPPTTSVTGRTTPIFTRGEIDRASEREVFDAMQVTGGGELLPVEPAVVVELPAGLYSVRVDPFEDLPAQPARPGVAIVEVFELSGRGSRD